MKQIWYTLAVSNYGTIKMQFRDEMSFKEAQTLGKIHCDLSKYAYGGTFSKNKIDEKEEQVRKILYEDVQ